MDQGAIAFYIVAASTVVASLGVVLTRNVVYSALLLIAALSLTGLVYLLLLSDFLAIVQILIYGGTVSILLFFALMLTRPADGTALNHRAWPVAAVGAVAVLAIVAYGVLATDWSAAATLAGAGRAVEPVRVSPEELGTALFTTWAVPFEIVSVVLIVALLGALQIARAAEGKSNGGR
jgi:NADH-quinone oxidoreductase subunit J